MVEQRQRQSWGDWLLGRGGTPVMHIEDSQTGGSQPPVTADTPESTSARGWLVWSWFTLMLTPKPAAPTAEWDAARGIGDWRARLEALKSDQSEDDDEIQSSEDEMSKAEDGEEGSQTTPSGHDHGAPTQSECEPHGDD